MSRSFHWELDPPPVYGGYIGLAMWTAIATNHDLCTNDTYATVELSVTDIPWLKGVRDTHPSTSTYHADAVELLNAIDRHKKIRLVVDP